MSRPRSEQLLLETRRIVSCVPGPHGELLLAALDLWEQSGMELQPPDEDGDDGNQLGRIRAQPSSEASPCSALGKQADDDGIRGEGAARHPHAHSAAQDDQDAQDNDLCSKLSGLAAAGIASPCGSTNEPIGMRGADAAVSILYEGSSWHCLPDDVAETVFAPLAAEGAASCRLVCKSFCRQMDNNLRSLDVSIVTGALMGPCLSWINGKFPTLRSLSVVNVAERDKLYAPAGVLEHEEGQPEPPSGTRDGEAAVHKGMVALSQMTGLERLAIGNMGFVCDSFGVKQLVTLTRLRDLNLVNCATLTDAGLECLTSNLCVLESLVLGVCLKITEKGLKSLQNVARTLKRFAARGRMLPFATQGPRIADNGLRHLRQLQGLEELDLSFWQEITGVGLAYLTGLQNLRSLVLNGCNRLDEICLQHVSGLASLTALDIGNNERLHGRFMHSLEQMKTLTVLRASFCSNLCAGLGGVPPGLTELNLDGCRVYPILEGLLRLQLPCLQILYLGSPAETDIGFRDISRISGEDPRWMDLTLIGLAMNHPGLRDLYLHGMPYLSVPGLVGAMTHAPKLEMLQLKDCWTCEFPDMDEDEVAGFLFAERCEGPNAPVVEIIDTRQIHGSKVIWDGDDCL